MKITERNLAIRQEQEAIKDFQDALTHEYANQALIDSFELVWHRELAESFKKQRLEGHKDGDRLMKAEAMHRCIAQALEYRMILNAEQAIEARWTKPVKVSTLIPSPACFTVQ